MAGIIHKRGDTFRYTVTLTDENGSPVDITGWTLSAQARRKATSDATPLFSVDNDGTGGISITDGAAGQARFDIAAGTTALWTYGAYQVDVQFDTGSLVFSTETFTLEVRADVTR